ncbi:MAG: flagellar basal body P-ring formation chaperone FlgA [Planctomycetota bacterium]
MRTRIFCIVLLLAATMARAESFVVAADAASVELASEVRLVGDEVRLAQVARWSVADEPMLRPLADIVVADAPGRYLEVTADDVRNALRREGIAPSRLRFTGALACTVTRLDTTYDADAALAAWAEPAEETKPTATLNDLLLADFARRIGLSVEQVSVEWDAGKSAHILKLPAALFDFDIALRRGGGVGPVRWDVTVRHDGRSETHSVSGRAVRYVDVLTLQRSISKGATIQPDDLISERIALRTAVKRDFATVDQLAGVLADRDLDAGIALTVDMLRPIPLVERGQFVSVSVRNGGIAVKTVAKALETGSLGQAIRVRDEATRRNYIVFVTGPQAAAVDDRAASLTE